MAFDISNSLHAIETYCKNLGLFQTVQIGEPKSPLLSTLVGNLLADTDLESTVMSIDAAGMDGGSVTSTFGYADVGGTMYRIVDISIPLIVNGSATLSGTGV